MRFGFAAQSADMPFSVEVTESLKDAAAIVGVDLLILDNRYDAAIAVKNAEEFNSKVDHTVPPYNYVSHRMVTRETPNWGKIPCRLAPGWKGDSLQAANGTVALRGSSFSVEIIAVSVNGME